MVVGFMAAQYAMQNKKKVGGLIAILVALLALLVGGIVAGIGMRNDNRNMLIGGGVTLGIGAIALVIGSLLVRSAKRAKTQQMPQQMPQQRWREEAQQPLLGTSFESEEGYRQESPYQPLPSSAFLDAPQQTESQRQSSSGPQSAVATSFGAPRASAQESQREITKSEIEQLVQQAVQSPQAQQAIRAQLSPSAQRKFDAAMLFANQNPELVQRAMRAAAAPRQISDVSADDISQLVQRASASPEAQAAIRARLSPAMQRKFDAAVLFANQNPEVLQQAMGAVSSAARAFKQQRQRAA